RTARRDAEQRSERARAEAAALAGRAQQAEARLADLDVQIAALTPERDEAEAALADARRAGASAPDLTLLRQEVERARAASAAAAAALADAERHEAASGVEARTAEQALYAAREAVVRAEGAVEQAAQAWQTAQDSVAERLGALTLPPPPADLSAEAEEKARAKW